jgi:hypothetical protein
MDVVILSEREADPASRPALPADLFDAVEAEGGGDLTELVRMAKLVPLDPLWRRLEDWIAWRWGAREVVWLLEGPGAWPPRLRPYTIDATEVWAEGWQAVTLAADPLGLRLEEGTYRITATVGTSDAPPPDVAEALRRLAMYTAQMHDHPGGSTGDGEGTWLASWPARAIHYSGAADLLRKYRRA